MIDMNKEKLPTVDDYRSTAFPKALSALDAKYACLIDHAIFLAACGRYDDCDEAFNKVHDESPHYLSYIEHAETYRLRGLQRKRLDALNQALALRDRPKNEDSEKFISLFIELNVYDANIVRSGSLSDAFLAALDIRTELRERCIFDEMGEFEVQSFILYHTVIQTCSKFSNWPQPEHRYIFHSSSACGGECAELATFYQNQDRWKEGFALLSAGAEYETNEERKLEVLKRISVLLQKASASDDWVQAVLAVKYRSTFAMMLIAARNHKLAASHHTDSLDLMNRWSNSVGNIITDNNVDLLQKSRTTFDETAGTSNWKTLLPHIELNLRELGLRGPRQCALPLTVAELNTLVLDGAKPNMRAKRRALLIEGVTVATADDWKYSNQRTAEQLKTQESKYLDFESEPDPDALFLAAAMSRILARPGSIYSWSEALRRVKEFFVMYPEFDVPVQQYALSSLAAKAAARTGSKVRWTDEKGLRDPAQARLQCPQYMGDSDASLTTEAQNDPLYYRDQIHSLNQPLDWMSMFLNCLKLMQKWIRRRQGRDESDLVVDLSELSLAQRSQQPAQGIKEPEVYPDVHEILGQRTEAPSRFSISADTQWTGWLNRVQSWLLNSNNDGILEQRHFVLKILLIVRTVFASESCMMTNGELPSYATLLIRVNAMQRRYEVYPTLHPSALSPNDRRQARSGIVSNVLSLCWFPEALQDGSLNDDRMRHVEMESDNLTSEYRSINNQRLEFAQMCEGARIRWMRYKIFMSIPISSSLEILEQAEQVSRRIRTDQATIVTSQTARDVGLEFLTVISSETKDFEPVDHYPIALCSAIESVTTAFQALQLALREGQTASCVEERRRMMRTAKETLALWIQRSKARSIMEIMGIQTPLPDPQSISNSLHGRELIQREIELLRLFRSARFDERVRLQNKLDECRHEMRQDAHLSPFLDLREARPISLREIEGVISSSSGQDSALVFIDFFQADWRTPHSDIFMLIYRNDGDPKVRAAPYLKFEDLELWRRKCLYENKPLSNNNDAGKALQKLENLMLPIKDLTKPGETLVFCPVGVLHSIPLHAITIDGDFLIQRNPVIYCQSFSHLKHCVSSSTNGQLSTLRPILMHGVNSTWANGQPRNSASVVEDLAQSWNSHRIHSEALSNKKQTIKSLEDKNIIYWHGHAVFNTANPMQSALCLSDPPKPQAADRITASDIFRIRLKSPALVVLMGCQSGVSESSGSGDLLGLSTAFYAAGASSIVSALWKIDDDDAAAYSKAFFEALRNRENLTSISGESSGVKKLINLAKVHRGAMLSVMGGDGSDDAAGSRGGSRPPYHWAGFTLNGSWLWPWHEGL